MCCASSKQFNELASPFNYISRTLQMFDEEQVQIKI